MNDWRARPIDNILLYCYVQSIASEQEDSCNSPATSSHGRWFSIKRENSNCMAEYLSEKLVSGFERYLYIIYRVYNNTWEWREKKPRPIEWVFRLYCPSRDDDYNDVPPFRRDDDVLFLRLTRDGKKKIVFFICLFSFPLSDNHFDIYIYVCTTNNLLNFSRPRRRRKHDGSKIIITTTKHVYIRKKW